METVLLLIVGFVLAYVIVYTPVSGLFEGSKESLIQKGDDKKLVIPEDSALKRHFLSNLQAEIESGLSPRPTCSMLKRHHDAMVSMEMESRLVVSSL